MIQVVYYKVKNNRTAKTAKIECRVTFVDSAFKPVTFIANETKLKLVVGKSSSAFGQKLAINGELTLKIRIREWEIREIILERLKKEFGTNFTITFLSLSDSMDPRKSFKKKIGTAPKRSLKKMAKKSAKKRSSRKGKTDEDFSNFTGEFKEEDGMISFPIKGYEGLGGIEMGDVEYLKDFEMVDEGEENNYDTVEVLFATDRNKTGSTEPNETFGFERNSLNKLELGVCKISIPKDHEEGKIERPSWFDKLFFSNPENPLKHVMIYDLQTKTEADFLSCLNSKITSSTNKDAFIFIHGFNVSFPEAIRRTAQIAHDLSFKGAAISYSWPSLSKVNGYMSDEDSVMWTVPHLKQLIKNVLSDSTLVKLHLIAHSMGNRALTNAIKELKTEGFDLEKINQIILAAPDIDSNVFTDVIVPGIKGVSKQITLYASSKDKALKASRGIRSGIIRAGESGTNIVIVEGVSTVDASKVDTNFLGHGYFAETKELINDIYLILEHSFIPAQRKLKQKNLPSKGFYWLFPS